MYPDCLSVTPFVRKHYSIFRFPTVRSAADLGHITHHSVPEARLAIGFLPLTLNLKAILKVENCYGEKQANNQSSMGNTLLLLKSDTEALK